MFIAPAKKRRLRRQKAKSVVSFTSSLEIKSWSKKKRPLPPGPNPERKTLDDHTGLTELERIRQARALRLSLDRACEYRLAAHSFRWN